MALRGAETKARALKALGARQVRERTGDCHLEQLHLPVFFRAHGTCSVNANALPQKTVTPCLPLRLPSASTACAYSALGPTRCIDPEAHMHPWMDTHARTASLIQSKTTRSTIQPCPAHACTFMQGRVCRSVRTCVLARSHARMHASVCACMLDPGLALRSAEQVQEKREVHANGRSHAPAGPRQRMRPHAKPRADCTNRTSAPRAPATPSHYVLWCPASVLLVYFSHAASAHALGPRQPLCYRTPQVSIAPLRRGAPPRAQARARACSV